MGGLSRTADRIDVAVTRDERRAAAIWLAGGTIWFVFEAIAAIAFPGYSYARNYISDLGNPAREIFDGRLIDSRLAWVLNLDLIVHGLAFLLGALFAFRANGRGTTRYLFVALVALNAFGGFVVAMVHSSNHALANGTESLHGLAALASILCGNLAIFVAASAAGHLGASGSYRIGSVLLAAIGIGCLVVVLGGSPHARADVGLWERGSVYPIMIWEIVTGIAVLTSAGRSPLRTS